MLIFDQLKKDDPQLRFLAFVVLGGMFVLFAGLWWVQVVSTQYYNRTLERQSIRTVRLPAVRGKILDRDGRALAENQPSYSISLYMEELSGKYQSAYAVATNTIRQYLGRLSTEKQKELGRKLTTAEKKQFAFTLPMRDQLGRQIRYEVTSNLLCGVGLRLNHPLELSEKDFDQHYQKALAIPLPVLTNLNDTQVAMFAEQSLHTPAMDLDVQSVRVYTNGSVAAHLLGYLNRTNYSDDDEEIVGPRGYNFRLDDYAGVAGIERLFNSELRGTAGAKSVLVNNYGYRRGETILSPAEAGENIVLTIDLDIQKAAERALDGAQANVRGAVVVMEARTGDILAMASAPTFDPNHFLRHPDPNWNEDAWSDEKMGMQKNKAMQENYRPGSTFKIVVGLAALETGVLDPKELFTSLGYYPLPGGGRIGDTAKEGEFDFDRAMAMSSNPYFITQGVKPGVLAKIISLAHQFHFGERTGLLPGQEVPGRVPNPKSSSSHWYGGDTMYLSIGQGEIDVTPLQMAVMTAAVANGGNVLWPRIVSGIKSSDGDVVESFPQARVRDTLKVNPRNLEIVRHAMLQDVESPEGTGREAAIPGFQIAGKTGTAEVGQTKKTLDRSAKETWFVSFAPYENPRYVVVAFVDGGASGGKTCVPVVKKIYEALLAKEKLVAAKTSLPAPAQN